MQPVALVLGFAKLHASNVSKGQPAACNLQHVTAIGNLKPFKVLE